MTVVRESMEMMSREELAYKAEEDRFQGLKSRWIQAECSGVDASRTVGEGALSRQ